MELEKLNEEMLYGQIKLKYKAQCPYCGLSDRIYFRKRENLYLCRHCKKTFNEKTRTVFQGFRTSTEQILKAIEIYSKITPIKLNEYPFYGLVASNHRTAKKIFAVISEICGRNGIDPSNAERIVEVAFGRKEKQHVL